MTDNEIKALAKLLQPYRGKVEEVWGRQRPRAVSSPTELLTIPETAAVLGYKDRGTVYDLISSGALRAVDIRATGRQAKTRVRRDDLQDFIDSRTRRSPR
ncbi:helix-turn-helix domain-containing protein [Blastococcus sp. TBT05-19]|uniref:helix-turn-helix domain-containing protein n=1 Tax=Blastococcus sp. TBT05-19 TaxID=2250581 RepID=UPI001314DE57|nr:helix-turn-helix domain-containing protein [Blastococcus sp. TBT05-19]